MTAVGQLNVTFLSGLANGQTADVPISVAEMLCEMGWAKLTTPGEPAADPDVVFIPAKPALDV